MGWRWSSYSISRSYIIVVVFYQCGGGVVGGPRRRWQPATTVEVAVAVVAAVVIVLVAAAVVVGGWVDNNLRLCVSVCSTGGGSNFLYTKYLITIFNPPPAGKPAHRPLDIGTSSHLVSRRLYDIGRTRSNSVLYYL